MGEGVISRDIRLEPFGMFQKPRPVHNNAPLNPQMTALAQGYDIPPSAIILTHIEMMDGQHVAGFSVVIVTAPYTLPSGFILDSPSYVLPVGRVTIHNLYLRGAPVSLLQEIHEGSPIPLIG